MATRRVPFEPGLLEALAAASSASELGQYSDRITIGSLFKGRAIQRGGRPESDPGSVKELLDVACHALDLIEQHLSTEAPSAAAAAAAAGPPPALLLPPGAASTTGSLMCVVVTFTEMATNKEQRHGPLAPILCASDLPQRLAGACAAVSKAISSSSSSSSSSHQAAEPAAAGTDSRRLEGSGTPFLLASMLSAFASLADVAGQHSRAIIPRDRSAGFAVLSNPHLLAACRAAAGLALAVLRSQALLSCSAKAVQRLMQRVLQTHTVFFLSLVMSAIMAIESTAELMRTPHMSALRMDPHSEEAALFVQLSREPPVQQAVLLYSALAVAAFHERQHGTSPVRAADGAVAAAAGGGSQLRARQQQQQQGQRLLVPPFHQQLLQALGVADVVLAGKCHEIDSFRKRASGPDGCQFLGSATSAARWVCGNLNSFAAAPAMQQLACPALLLMVESACLAPDWQPVEYCLDPCFNLMLRLRDAVGIRGGLPVVPQQQLLAVLQAVLTLLLPTVRHDLEQRGSDAAASECSNLLGLLAVLATGLALDAVLTDEASAALPLADLMLQHSGDYCSLLEAAVRELLNSKGSVLLLNADAAGRLATAVRSRASGGQLAALLADEAAGLQLYALVVSCIKGAQLPRANSGSNPPAAGGGAAACLRQLRSFVVAAAPLAPRSTRLLALLAGRCLVALGTAAAEQYGGASMQQGVLEGAAGLLAWAVEAVLPDADAWAAVSGPAAAADPAARLRLLEAARQLQQQLDTASRAWDEAAAAGQERPGGQAFAAVDGVPLAQQLAAFGAALCAQLPGRFCCNNHGCTNMATASELQLVAGAGTVCSGCKTARYCSAACQNAHWKEWHKPVCKAIKKQQQQPPAASKGKPQKK